MIVIRNTQRKIKVDIERLKEDAQTILNALNYADFDLGILLTNNKTIHTYNLTYRQKDKPTDILSFANYPTLKPGKRIKPLYDDDKNLGDLILCPEYILNDLPRWGKTFEQRLQILLVHGICHLLGYDHETDAEYKVMHRKELALLRLLKI